MPSIIHIPHIPKITLLSGMNPQEPLRVLTHTQVPESTAGESIADCMVFRLATSCYIHIEIMARCWVPSTHATHKKTHGIFVIIFVMTSQNGQGKTQLSRRCRRSGFSESIFALQSSPLTPEKYPM